MPDRRGEDNERLSIESPSCHTHRRSYLPERTTRRAGATGKLLSKLLAIGEREQTENNRFPINKHRRIWLSYRGGGTDSDPHDRYLPKRESGNPASHDVLFFRIRQIGLYKSAGTNHNSRAVMWKHPYLVLEKLYRFITLSYLSLTLSGIECFSPAMPLHFGSKIGTSSLSTFFFR